MRSFEYLIGKPINNFEEKLPRKVDIVRYYFHFQKTDEKEKISKTSKQIQLLYNRANIPTVHYESIRSKVKRLLSSVKIVIATRKSKSASQIERETSLFHELSKLFEVTRNEYLLSEEKKCFLADQRNLRRRLINADLSNANQFSSSREIQDSLHDSEETISPQNEIEINQSSCIVESFDEFHDSDDSPDFLPSESNGKKIKLCHHDIRELGKCGGSYRVIEKALSIGIKTAGGNPKDYALSKSSLCAQINSFRSMTRSNFLEQIASSDEKVVIHFDGKHMAKLNKRHLGTDARMVVICHTRTDDVPLGLPILQSGSAQSHVNEIIELCENSNLIGRIVGMVCDTEGVNTGRWNGVWAVFENETGTEILHLACRHHVKEVLLGAAFLAVFGRIEAPTLTIFDQLKTEWLYIQESGFQYKPCEQDVLELYYVRPLYIEAKNTLIEHAKNKFVRDDYAELTDLCLKFFGVKTKKSFMVPGAVSKSRWMAKAIYAIKMYLFRDLLNLEEGYVEMLLEFVLFIALVYCKHWNRCTNAFNAPVNDLILISELKQFSKHNEEIANSVLRAFQNHLWYLGEELSVLAIFSDLVSIEDKNIMRLKIASIAEYPARSNNSIRLQKYIDGMKLTDLITERSRFLFSFFNHLDFLEQRAETWKHNKSYKRTEKFVRELIVVVNDTAERALGRASNIVQNQKVRSETRFQNMLSSLYN